MANTRVENGRQRAIGIAKELCNLYLDNIDLIKIDADRKGDTILSNEAAKTASHITHQMQKVKSTTHYNEIEKMLQEIVNVAMHNLNVLVLERSYALDQKRENASHQFYNIRQLYNEVKTQLDLLEKINKKFQDLGLSDNLEAKYVALGKQINRIKSDSDLSVFQKQVANFENELLHIRDDINKLVQQQKKIPDKTYQEKPHFWQQRKDTQLLEQDDSKQHRMRK